MNTSESLGSDSRGRRAVTGFATAALALPLVPAVAESRVLPWFILAGLSFAVGAATAWWVAGRDRRPTVLLALLGGALVAVAGWVLPQAAVSLVTVLLGLGLGAGVGVAGGGVQALRRASAAGGAVVGILVLAALVAVDGTHGIAWAGLLYGIAVVVSQALARDGPVERVSGSVRAVAACCALVTVIGALWVGANSPTETWFGSQVSHGSRDKRAVAITFDDGPNDPYTLEIARILDEHGAKGTFFTVGMAVDARPDIVRALIDDGHLVGNHSFHHDSWGWLNPRYPELGETQTALRRGAGVCPKYYRAPHGQHTPFLVHVLDDHGMTMVGWDVSAGDFKASDGGKVARSVLDDVQPGSIIVLHDGLNGDVTADRSVVVRALPRILDGLERKGLKAVRLDRLLGERGYGDHC